MKIADVTSKPIEATPAENSAPVPAQEIANPEELLLALKAKQQLFSQLKNEGLIHKDHLPMEVKLQKTIEELEGLLHGNSI